MPRSSLIATFFNDAWGTAGTQYMKPPPFIEGLGSYAAKLDDRMCFLAFQQTDVVFSEDMNKQTYPSTDESFKLMDKYRGYYNGYHPQFLFGFEHRWDGVGDPDSATYSLRMGDVDFGTITVEAVSAGGGSVVDWYADIPDGYAAGEYMFQLYGASAAPYQAVCVAGPHLSLLPTRLF